MKIKIALIIVVIILIVIFALQNTEIVNIKLWFWEMGTPKALLIFVCLSIGVIIGLLTPSSKKDMEQAKTDLIK
jgi:uncharacterized integral membrane protein